MKTIPLLILFSVATSAFAQSNYVPPPGWTYVRSIDSLTPNSGCDFFPLGDTCILFGEINEYSTDQGKTWSDSRLPGGMGYSISTYEPMTVIGSISSYDSAVISTDLGFSYHSIEYPNGLLDPIQNLPQFSPYAKGSIYTGSYRSFDAGRTWVHVNLPDTLWSRFSYRLLFDARNHRRWYVSRIEKIGEFRNGLSFYHTDDDGSSFTKDSLRGVPDYIGIGHSGEVRFQMSDGFTVNDDVDASVPVDHKDNWFNKIIPNHSVTTRIEKDSGGRFAAMIDFDYLRNYPDTSVATFQDYALAYDSSGNPNGYTRFRHLVCLTNDNGRSFIPIFDDSVSTMKVYLDQTNPNVIWGIVTDSIEIYHSSKRQRLLRYSISKESVLQPQGQVKRIEASFDSRTLTVNCIPQRTGVIELHLIDILGRRVQSWQHLGVEGTPLLLELACPALVAGTYFLQSGNGLELSQSKLIILP